MGRTEVKKKKPATNIYKVFCWTVLVLQHWQDNPSGFFFFLVLFHSNPYFVLVKVWCVCVCVCLVLSAKQLPVMSHWIIIERKWSNDNQHAQRKHTQRTHRDDTTKHENVFMEHGITADNVGEHGPRPENKKKKKNKVWLCRLFNVRTFCLCGMCALMLLKRDSSIRSSSTSIVAVWCMFRYRRLWLYTGEK